ncbi:MAG TPA: copper transporter [Aeromicrobium sp.]|nr:copper transporter [Aeromicrobium sp.]
MINLRYHVISLAAVLFALGAGIALGAGALGGADEPVEETTSAVQQITPALAGFDAGYATATASTLLSATLKDRSVLVLTLPTARENEVSSLVDNLTLAGAKVTGEVGLTTKLLSPANRKFVEGVATQSNPDGATDGSDYQKVGAAIARGYLAKTAAESDDTARTIRAAFTQGGLLEVEKDPQGQAQLVLVVAGVPGAGTAGENTVVAGMIGGIDAGGLGTAVVGPVPAGEDGVVNAVRESDAAGSVSTLDVTDTSTGRVAAVLALVQDLAGKPGSWGTSKAADGPFPN